MHLGKQIKELVLSPSFTAVSLTTGLTHGGESYYRPHSRQWVLLQASLTAVSLTTGRVHLDNMAKMVSANSVIWKVIFSFVVKYLYGSYLRPCKHPISQGLGVSPTWRVLAWHGKNPRFNPQDHTNQVARAWISSSWKTGRMSRSLRSSWITQQILGKRWATWDPCLRMKHISHLCFHNSSCN